MSSTQINGAHAPTEAIECMNCSKFVSNTNTGLGTWIAFTLQARRYCCVVGLSFDTELFAECKDGRAFPFYYRFCLYEHERGRASVTTAPQEIMSLRVGSSCRYFQFVE